MVDLIYVIPSLAGMVLGVALAGNILRKRWDGEVERSLASLLVCIAIIQGGHALALLDGDRVPFWRGVALLGEIIFPILLFKVGMSFIQEQSLEKVQGKIWWYRSLQGVGLLCVGLVFIPSEWVNMEMPWLPFIHQGNVVGIYILLALVLAMAQFEQVLRASQDPLRYQLKFVLIGLGGLGGFEIFQATQFQFFSGWTPEYTLIGGCVTLIAVSCVAYGHRRWQHQEMGRRVSLSPQAMYASLTFLLVGGYFIVVGGLGELVRQTGWKMGDALGVFLLVVGGMAFVVVVASREARAQLRLVIARNFFRSKYDYRVKWLEVTEAFRDCHSVDLILDTLCELVSRTFAADRVTIWMVYESDGRYHQVRSINTEQPPDPLEPTHPIVSPLLNAEGVLASPKEEDQGPECLEFVRRTHAVLYAPLRVKGTLLGFVTLSEEMGHSPYSVDDFDLLQAIAHHASIVLMQIKLMDEQTTAAKWEAVSRFAAFYVHDLKTLTAGLSMVAQNAAVHGHDPAFQQSAIQTIRNIVPKMTDLMSKLSKQARSLEKPPPVALEPANLNEIVEHTLKALPNGSRQPEVTLADRLPPVQLAPGPFQQVILNLLQNARQSAGEEGRVMMETRLMNGQVELQIVNSGPAIPEARLRTLFQPFQTTKKDGFGIGLHQCKTIVEQCQGTIRVESQEGQPTRVCITLPQSVDSEGQTTVTEKMERSRLA